jgi:thiaminase/transcriptional activator TenA
LIEDYAGRDFEDSFAWRFDALDTACEKKTESELNRIREIFASSVEFEYLFWDMSYKMLASYSRG